MDKRGSFRCGTEALEIVHSEALRITSVAAKCLDLLGRGLILRRQIGCSLLHLHGVSPIRLAFEDEYLQVLDILFRQIKSDRLWVVLLLPVNSLGLCEPERLAQSQHASRAVPVVSTVVTVAKTILVLGCFYQS